MFRKKVKPQIFEILGMLIKSVSDNIPLICEIFEKKLCDSTS